MNNELALNAEHVGQTPKEEKKSINLQRFWINYAREYNEIPTY